MGCCSLRDSNEKFSRIGFLIRLTFFITLHKLLIFILFIRSLFNKNYKSILKFYTFYYKKCLAEIKSFQEEKNLEKT